MRVATLVSSDGPHSPHVPLEQLQLLELEDDELDEELPWGFITRSISRPAPSLVIRVTNHAGSVVVSASPLLLYAAVESSTLSECAGTVAGRVSVVPPFVP